MMNARVHALPVSKMLFGISDVADWLGVTVATVRTYHRDASRRRREGQPRVGDMPKPMQHVGGHPAWTKAQLEDWVARRPGRGRRTDLQPVKPATRMTAALGAIVRGDSSAVAAGHLAALDVDDLLLLQRHVRKLDELVAAHLSARGRSDAV